jgi:competence protein ComEC
MQRYDYIAICVLFFVVGIFSSQYNLAFGYLLCAATLCAGYISLYQKKWYAGLGVAIFLIAGFMYSALFGVLTAPVISFDENAPYTGTIISDVHQGMDNVYFDVSVAPPHRGTMTVYTENYYTASRGDAVSFSGKATQMGNAIFLFANKIEVTPHAGFSLYKILYAMKHASVENINRVLPQKQAALAVGLLFGESGGFSDAFKDELSKSGTTHIVALSGYNIMLIAGIMYGLAISCMKRRNAFFVSVLGILLFVCMVGASPSVLRAAIMGIMMLYATEYGRNYFLPFAMLYAAFGMLLWNPASAVSAGFQLSFCALAGLVYFGKPLQQFFNPKNIDGFFSWRKNLIQTCAAQLGVLPIVIIVFNNFSLRGIFANVLILQSIPYAMFFSFVTALVGFLSYYASVMCGMIAYIFLLYETGIIHIFGAW